MRCDRAAHLDAAAELAHAIAAAAIWDGGRCTWLGALPGDDPRGPRAVAALGPDLYGGTSGVALFLAEAAARLGDDGLRATAEGAIAHALAAAPGIAPDQRDGGYLGPIGVAYAAARVAGLLGSAEVGAGASALLGAWRRDATRSPSSDVMGGAAGAVAGLLAVAGRLELPWLPAEATRLGDVLLARARRGRAGWSWGRPGQRAMHDLCGFSHGAAGIGHALAELFAATGAARFGEAAERAFDYERSWQDPRTGTWPDLRGVGRAARRDAPVPANGSWCNGAAGIAVSRIRSAELLGSGAVRRDAELALAACERHGIELLDRAPRDFSLCHGDAGIGDVLLQVAAAPDDPRARLAAAIGRRGAGTGAPCGVAGATPALFLGHAGIGLFHLRLAGAPAESPLLIRPAALTAAPAPS